MRENLHTFGCVAPDPAQFQVQGRPRLVTPEAREGVLDFLLENGKLAYIDEVKFYLEDFMKEKDARGYFRLDSWDRTYK
jgi:hypothetical protein